MRNHIIKINKMRLIDIGANLTDPMFQGIYHGKQKHISDYEDILIRAKSNSIEKIIITAGSFNESINAFEKSLNNKILYSTLGVHPTRCNEIIKNPQTYFNQLLNIYENAKDKTKIVAIGECGLDYDRLEFCSKEIQIKYFIKQFELAEITKLPMFLHNRNTNGDFLKIIKENRKRFSEGVVHSFTGTLEEANELIQLGLYIGINGCSLKTQDNLIIAKNLPLEKIMIETDAPWCEIRPTHAGYQYVKTKWDSKKPDKYEKGKCIKSRNEPASLIQIVEIMSQIREEDPNYFAETVYNNTKKVFFSKEMTE